MGPCPKLWLMGGWFDPGGNIGKPPLAILHQWDRERQAAEAREWASRPPESDADRERRVERERQEKRRAERRAAIERELDAKLPQLQAPTAAPRMQREDEQFSAFWALCAWLPFWAGGTLVVGLIADSMSTGAVIAGALCLIGWCFALARFVKRQNALRARTATYAHECAAADDRARERSALRSALEHAHPK
jgi:hypothetical protein